MVKLTCAVCGDIATGYNFEVITCGSCKEFFRRTATRDEVFKCRFTTGCQIDVRTRKRCRKCRLDKCYAMGMNKDYINLRVRRSSTSLYEKHMKSKVSYSIVDSTTPTAPSDRTYDTNTSFPDIHSDVNYGDINSYNYELSETVDRDIKPSLIPIETYLSLPYFRY
ncbi:unnamed protein product [Oppiella nova]|uniref:Nuclear receptor domain-containing protein n=1 Tax=Oppiella nova TaxID=334625 RepID=A0A7R9M1Q0_9ACAR|nr:unnamed protein product [Oppiella nova]CAG2169117.1 unnamed protein product [Oppiella nova]